MRTPVILHANNQFPTGDGSRLRESIRKSILALPPDTMLLSGHSRPMTVAMLAASMR